MDIETLQQTLNSHLVGGVFTLDGGSLASTEIAQLFALYLSNQQLQLTGAAIASLENDTITVSGTGSAPPFTGMTVQVTFSIVNETVELLVSGAAPVDWTLPDSFPAWQHAFFPDLQFTVPPQLQLATSHASAPGGYGLFFHGVLDTQAVMGPFAGLINNQSALPLQGSITTDGTVPRTVLASDARATSPVTLGFLELSPVVLEVVTDENAIANPSPLRAPVILRFTTSVELVTGSGTIILPLQASFYGQDLIGFQSDLSQVVNASLQELSGLLNHVDITSPDLLPPGFKLEQILQLQYLTVQVEIGEAPQIKLVSLGIEKQGDPWQITSGIAIDDISVYFTLIDPLDQQYLTAGLYGVLAIGNGLLDISVEYPNFTVNGWLQENSQLNLLEIIEQFCGISETSNVGMDLIEVVELDFSLELSPLSYTFSFLLDGSWYVNLIDEIFFELQELSFKLDKPAGSGITGNLAATAIVAGVALSISASQPQADGGWNFEGSTGPGQAIPIGSLMDSLVNLFGDITLPAALSDMTIENLRVAFNSNSTDFTFTCESKLPVGDELLDITVMIDLKDGPDGYTKTFSGHILIGDLVFDLHFVQSAPSTVFVATYSHTGDAQGINVRDLVALVSADIANALPADLSIDLKDVIFAFSKDTTNSSFLFGLDISATLFALTDLPLVGKELPSDQSITVSDLQILVASQDIKQSLVLGLNALIPEDVTHLIETDLTRGLTLTASMTFGELPQILAVPVVATGTTNTSTPAPQATGVTTGDNTKWFTLQRSFGPLLFNRVGIQYKDAAVWFILDAALTAMGLTISLEGLSFGSPLDSFAPKVALQGLGIDYNGGDAVTITGAFLNAGNDEFMGEALIKTSELTISALGSYATLNGDPSLFVYAFLDQPIGGPSFFFVTGLAAGFGYNRSLIVPSIDQVSQFPLVEEVMSGNHRSLGDELRVLDRYIPPSTGDLFFALGVRFTSFKIIESFALLTVGLGSRVEVAILGLSTLISPPQEAKKQTPPLAAIFMELEANFAPEEGFLGINAQLTPASYLFARDCHLVGGYAFYSWFSGEHEGDFVMTLGGYHPAFAVPDHYPRVPRAGFSWQIDSHLLMKGTLYYALTASAMMAGGSLEVTWDSGPFQAWFSAGADFLIAWKPYHYDARLYVNIGASYTFHFLGTHHITVDVGASVHVWGPDFSGLAHIDLSIISFDISFGSGSSQIPQPIDWNTFRTSFLPESGAMCSIAIKSGLVSMPQTGNIQWVVNAKDLSLALGTVIPITEATLNQIQIDNMPVQSFGVGPMEVSSDDVLSQYAITITRENQPVAHDDFVCVPVLKNMPVALWGQQLQPDLKASAFIVNAPVGFLISPKQTPTTGETVVVDPEALHFTPDPLSNPYTWQSPITFSATTDTEDARRAIISQTVAAPATVSARAALLDALTLDVPIDVNSDVATTFLVAPQISRA